MLPEFTRDGVLPSGDFELTLGDLQSSMLVAGPDNAVGDLKWDSAWREKLCKNLAILVRQLWQVGITQIYIDGSFVEDKQHPNDIDGYFECPLKQLASGELQRDLNQLDPHDVWTWDPASRRPYRDYPKRQLPMWHLYRIELYPHYGQPCGIRDQFGHELEFPSAFRQSRDGVTKGIIKIKSESQE